MLWPIIAMLVLFMMIVRCNKISDSTKLALIFVVLAIFWFLFVALPVIITTFDPWP